MIVIGTLSIYNAHYLFFYKKSQIKLGLHLVLVTLHGGFTINIEQDNEPLRAKGPLVVGEEVRKEDVGKVRS
jgi:hypothetical protein